MTTLWLIHIWLVCRYTINSFRDLHQIAVRVLISCFPSLNNSLVLSGQSIPLSLHPLRSTLFSHQQCVIIFERAKAQNRGKDGLIIPEVGSMSTLFFFSASTRRYRVWCSMFWALASLLGQLSYHLIGLWYTANKHLQRVLHVCFGFGQSSLRTDDNMHTNTLFVT